MFTGQYARKTVNTKTKEIKQKKKKRERERDRKKEGGREGERERERERTLTSNSTKHGTHPDAWRANENEHTQRLQCRCCLYW
jgi:hypothetical protein